MPSIKLAVFDLDHTLIGPEAVFSPAVRTAVAKAQSLGVRVTIATGRNPVFAARMARDLRLHTPIITYQGGVILDVGNNRELRSQRLPRHVLPAAYAFAEAQKLPLQFEESGRIIAGNDYPIPPDFAQLIETPLEPIYTPDALQPTPHKFLMMVQDPAKRRQLRDNMRAAFNGDLTITPSHPQVVEALPLGISKGVALQWLCGKLGIAAAQVLAMGDNDNDVSMISWAGVGVAVADGSEEALAAADWVAPTQREDGVAVAIDRFILRDAWRSLL